MKKIIIALMATAALSGDVSAKGFTGYYLGLDAAANLYKVDYSLNGGGGALNPLYVNANGYTSSFNMGFFAGYSKLYSTWFVLGAEIFGCGDIDKLKAIQSSQWGTISTRNKGLAMGVLFRAGVLFTEKTALMIGLGGKSTSHEYLFIDNRFRRASNNFVVQKNQFQFTLQIGLEGFFGNTDSLAWRAIYGFTPGTDVHVSPLPPAGIFGDPPRNASRGRFKTEEQTMRFGVSYRF